MKKKRKLPIFPQKNHYLGNRCFCRYLKIEKTSTYNMYPKLFSDLKRKTNHIQRFLLVRNSRLKKNYVKCKMKLLWLFYYSLLRAKAKTGDEKKNN